MNLASLQTAQYWEPGPATELTATREAFGFAGPTTVFGPLAKLFALSLSV